jgi:hypothetical protein
MLPKELYIFLLVGAISRVHAFNLDVLSPTIVLPDGSDPLGTDFGFSIAQHEISENRKLLLIGAPKALHNGITEGSVYVCEFQNGSRCVKTDSFNNREIEDTFFQLSMMNVSYNGQLMGYSIHSSHNRVVACAPLFIDTFRARGTLNIGNVGGRCIALSKYLNDTFPTQLISELLGGSMMLSVGGVDTKFFTRSSADYLAIGSVYTGSSNPHPGAVFTVNIENTNLQTGLANIPTSVPYDELRGYHLEIGHFAVDISQNVDEIISSAPKANSHKGQIRAYSTTSTDPVEVWSSAGTEADGYFGYDFALLDLKKNGYHSIAVGCPFCNRNRGRVTLYLHSGDYSNPVNQTLQIDSPSQQQGEFGYSVERLGDINRDGFDDVAISAPYIDGGGAVYIYIGNEDGIQLYQTLHAKPGMDAFGITLTGGIDMDSNGYPDLTIGDLTGTQIVTIRSSPIVNVDLSLVERDLKLNYNERNCVIDSIELVCFNVTPCFNFTSVFGDVSTFAVKYTLKIDELKFRIGLFNATQMNQITQEIILIDGQERTCSSPHTFVLLPGFTSIDPFPLELTITNADELLPLPSPTSSLYGGPLHPVLNPLRTTQLQQMIVPELISNCGDDDICNPIYEIDVVLEGNSTQVPLAAAYQLPFNVKLKNTNEDSFAAYIVVAVPEGIEYIRSDLVRCEFVSTQMIQCPLKNPIVVNETFEFNLLFRPNVRVIDLSTKYLEFNFTIRDDLHEDPLADYPFNISSFSIARYDKTSSFGTETAQASRSLGNLTNDPTITYQITISNNLLNNEGSPIPTTHLTITWPFMIDFAGQKQPLLVPRSLRVVGSNNTICRQMNAIPSELLHGSPHLILPAITQPVTPQYCPRGRNITCGVIQCTINQIQALPSDNTTVVAPVQISLFARLWSPSIRDQLNITVYANVESTSEYPEILNGSVKESFSSISLIPAVTEIMVECVEPWIIAVSVVGGLLIIIVFILCAVVVSLIDCMKWE